MMVDYPTIKKTIDKSLTLIGTLVEFHLISIDGKISVYQAHHPANIIK